MITPLKRVLSFILLSSAVFAQRRLLINPSGLPALPSEPQAQAAAATTGLDIGNVQADILVGMLKNKELFFFFNITDVAGFKTHLAQDLHPLLTSSTQALNTTNTNTTMLNIAFSKKGFDVLGIDSVNDLQDPLFTNGQADQADTLLGDAGGTAGWQDEFKPGNGMHGVILIASNDVDAVNNQATSLLSAFDGSITEVYRLLGQARPNSNAGHEHFGFKDGISQPAVIGFNDNTAHPGQTPVNPGVILVGENGDTNNKPRASWTKDGSFLAFRQLKQLVPEFDKFLLDNALSTSANGTALSQQEGADLLGARMVGRWKSGAPIDITPFADDPALGNDANRNNNFNFSDATDNVRCPFSAHIRKTNPRADLNAPTHHIMRSGIPYGPEVSDDEASSNTSGNVERGLAFVSYQATISVGFQFLQHTWANNPAFIRSGEGFDPIIGENQGQPKQVGFLDPNNTAAVITLPQDFVVSRGGEYFFAPSLSAILDTIAA